MVLTGLADPVRARAIGGGANVRLELMNQTASATVLLESPQLTGVSVFAEMIMRGEDLAEIFADRVARGTGEPADAGAMMDLSTILLLTGQMDLGLEIQAQALAQGRTFKRIHGDGRGLTVLALVTTGGMMANTPLDFMLAGSNTTVHYVYSTLGRPFPEVVPGHDVAFLGIGQSHEADPLLDLISDGMGQWPRPLVNGFPQRISALTRDGVAALCSDLPDVYAPAVMKVSGQALKDMLDGGVEALVALPGGGFPIIIRPLGSHAGQELVRIADPEALGSYLAGHEDAEFYVSQFVDYSNADGLFRKMRIAVIDGVPFLSHLAISENWMVHYLNADMHLHESRRQEEARAMAEFETDLGPRLAPAISQLTAAFGLDYYAIDCAILPDGRLLVFEADVAMIVHAMDDTVLFPYKPAAMQKIFKAFQGMLKARAGHS